MSCLPGKSESASQFAIRMENYLERWVELAGIDKSFNRLKDLLLREQFISASLRNLALFLKERKPINITEMAELDEQYLEAHGSQYMTNDKLAGQGKKPIYLERQEMRNKPQGEGGKDSFMKGNSIKVCYFC